MGLPHPENAVSDLEFAKSDHSSPHSRIDTPISHPA